MVHRFISENDLNPAFTNMTALKIFTILVYQDVGISKNTFCSFSNVFLKDPSHEQDYLKHQFNMLVSIVSELGNYNKQSVCLLCYYLILEEVIKNASELWEIQYTQFGSIDIKAVAIKKFVSILPPMTHENEKSLRFCIGTDIFQFICWLYSKNMLSGNLFIAAETIIPEIVLIAKEEELKLFKERMTSSDEPCTKANITLADVDIFSGVEFERFVGTLFVADGYHIEYTRISNDKGIDLIARKNGTSIGIQCKCYSSSVGISAVQEVFAGKSYYSLDKALVITNNYFTQAAIDLAKSTGVILWDRNILEAKMSVL